MNKEEAKTAVMFASWDPLFEDLPGGDLNDYRQYIFDHVNFKQVLKTFKLRPEDCPTGKYTHKMVCPFKFHKQGRERTGSFRFHEKKKTFTCFGCSTSGDILTFFQIYRGGGEQYNLQRLASLAGLLKDGEFKIPDDYVEPEPEVYKETNYKLLFGAGLALRQYLIELNGSDSYREECEWADQMLVKIDKYFHTIGEENLEDAKKICDNLEQTIKKRKKRIL